MALTMAQLREARDAGTIMADIAQPYGQGDTPLSATENPAVIAAIEAVASRAIVAAEAIGGTGTPLPATSLVVASGSVHTPVTVTGTGTTATITVAGGKITGIALS